MEDLEPIDLSGARMKCIGAQWLVRLHEYLCNSPDIIVNGFHASGIPQSLSSGIPQLSESADEDHSTDDDEDHSTDDDEFTDSD